MNPHFFTAPFIGLFHDEYRAFDVVDDILTDTPLPDGSIPAPERLDCVVRKGDRDKQLRQQADADQLGSRVQAGSSLVPVVVVGASGRATDASRSARERDRCFIRHAIRFVVVAIQGTRLSARRSFLRLFHRRIDTSWKPSAADVLSSPARWKSP